MWSEDKTAGEQLTQTQARRTRFRSRLYSLLAYSFAVLASLYGASLAFDAYHDTCAKEVTITATDPSRAVGLAMIMMIGIALPTWLARSNALVAVNLCLSVVTAIFAAFLLFTASTPPYECFTMGGSYEDHVQVSANFPCTSLSLLLFPTFSFCSTGRFGDFETWRTP